MVDRTSARLEVVAVGDGEEQAILDIINEYGLHLDGWGNGIADDETELVLGGQYADSEFGCGYGEDLTTKLLEVAPGSTWELIEDPAYEWSGDYYCYIPALGFYAAPCNGEGQPVFTADQVLNMTKLSETALIKELGLPWQLEFRRLSKIRQEINESEEDNDGRS